MDKAMELLEQLAAKIGQTVEILWPHAVRYQAISAMVTLTISTLVAAVLWFAYWKFSGQPWFFDADTSGTGDDYPSAKFFLMLAAPIPTFIAVMTWLVQFPVVLEPMGYIIMKIIGKQISSHG